jgi:hypothetical protein
MHKPILENVTIYKIPSSPLDNESLKNFGSFMVKSSRHPFVYFASTGDSEYSKIFDKMTKEKIIIDKLFYPDERNAKKVCMAMSEVAACKLPLISSKQIKEQVEEGLKEVVNSNAEPKDLKKYANDILKLSRKERNFNLKKRDMVFLSQLNSEGWVLPEAITLGKERYYPPSLNFHENYGLIKTKILMGENMFVKLTKRGKKLKENILKQAKKILESRELPDGAFPSIFQKYPMSETDFRKDYFEATR